ncbi:50S ribosomal protein L1 [Trichoplax sp. H2]|uniref:Large ribosomal subunit protein uL1 n=1 Tax=Trichoplax adhaerens TaxID=10228 RepID=B3RW11_TRIAD|nr:hypothetical protein TRIADDRAFT_55847 [Trichoplax adhaerens]EDV26093.1 hypothetical protein TRIADDRAFT_55847 [Trichoplax adhaerens]RDD38293.1 50S ribosomal protein L1 [Trichoplax sp. H2]|eukprot:XP_002112126.1 hypothetical protein TRIADDRAFT_55847 [Trichoplax adhaerens]
MAYYSLWKTIFPRPGNLTSRFYAAVATSRKATREKEDTVTFSSNNPRQPHDIDTALLILKAYALGRVNETLELSIRLNLMENKSKQRDASQIRGTIYLPRNYFQDRTVYAFADGEVAETAKKCGVQHVGSDDLIEKIQNKSLKLKKKQMRFLTTKTYAKKIRSLQPILRSALMPNKRKDRFIVRLSNAIILGSIVEEVTVESVDRLKRGIEYRSDKNGIINIPIGKLNFPASDVKRNVNNVIDEIMTHKGKGRFILQKFLSSTRGPGVLLE